MFLEAAAVALGSALVVVVRRAYFHRSARLVRAMQAAPRRPIGEVAVGELARVVGTVDGPAPLRGPLSNRACAYYELTIEERNDDQWVVLAREVAGREFTIVDGATPVVVDPRAATLVVVVDATAEVRAFDHSSARQRALLARHQLATGERRKHRRDRRFREGVIEPGEEIAVVGWLVREIDPRAARTAAGYRDVLPTRLRLGGSRARALLISDEPGARR